MNADVPFFSERKLIHLKRRKLHTKGSSQKILQLLKIRTVLRPADLDELGIPRITLHRLHKRGQVEKVAHGLYQLPNAEISEHHSLAEAARWRRKELSACFPLCGSMTSPPRRRMRFGWLLTGKHACRCIRLCRSVSFVFLARRD